MRVALSRWLMAIAKRLHDPNANVCVVFAPDDGLSWLHPEQWDALRAGYERTVAVLKLRCRRQQELIRSQRRLLDESERRKGSP